MSDTANCYAVRRLNPFLGVLEVVEIEGARALSVDGLDWQIQVEADRPDHTWGRGAPATAVRQFFRFGSWHVEHGLSRVPVNPILDVGAMLSASERLIDALQAAQAHLPFAFADHVERWLLAADGRPLALLAATVARRFTQEIHADGWQATPAMSPDFTAPGLTALGIAASNELGNRRHADALERQVLGAAGPSPRRCWYERQPDGSALPLDSGFAGLPADAFPELPLRRHWTEGPEATLLGDYLHWLAPRLLCLDTLDDATRLELEQAARRQALQVADHYRLYPKVLQRELLDSARVEARLRRATG